MRGPRSVVVSATGHQAIRTSHAKTLEVTRETDITERATCVAGVGAAFDPEELGALRGRVHLTLSAAGRSVSGDAVVNPYHEVRERLVVRRSGRTDPDTLLVDSTLTAAHIGPDMASSLRDPEAEVTLTVTESAPPSPLVMVCPAEPGGRLGALWRAAPAVVDLDAPDTAAASAALEAVRRGDSVAASLSGSVEAASDAALDWIAEAARAGARLLLAGAAPAASALLSSGKPLAPALRLGSLGRKASRSEETVRMLRTAPVPAVLALPAADAATVLAPLRAAAPERRLAVPEPVLDVGTAMRWTTVEAAVEEWGQRTAGTALVVLDRCPDDGSLGELGGVLRALADAGVSARTLSEALRPLGVRRKAIYELVGGPADRRRPPGDPGRP